MTYTPIGDPVIDAIGSGGDIFADLAANPPTPSKKEIEASWERAYKKSEANLVDALAKNRALLKRAENEVIKAHNRGLAEHAPYLRAGFASSMSHELNYRAWRAVAESLATANAGGSTIRKKVVAQSTTPGKLSGESMSMAVLEYAAQVPEYKPAVNPTNLRRLARVERWRLLAQALVGQYEPHPDDVEEGTVSFFKVRTIRNDGTDARPVVDIVEDFERRRPGLMANIAQSGHQALRELKKVGLLPDNAEALLLDASSSMRTEFEGHLANLRAALEQAEQSRKLADDAINTLHVKIEELTKAAATDIGERPKMSIFGGAEKIRRWDEAAEKKRLAAEELAEQNRAREEAEKVRGALDKHIKAVTENITKIERDLTLGVPEFAAIAYAGDASHLPGLGG